MTTLLIKFAVSLLDYDVGPARHHGPLFHRWLPNGESDKLEIKTGNPDAELSVWFRRRGCLDSGMIRFDYTREEVDPEIMSKSTMLTKIVRIVQERDCWLLKADKRGQSYPRPSKAHSPRRGSPMPREVISHGSLKQMHRKKPELFAFRARTLNEIAGQPIGSIQEQWNFICLGVSCRRR
jgi:hypothetical protein